MHLLAVLAVIVLAGILNGSYGMPLKHMQALPQPVLWLLFSFVGLLLFPLLTLWLLVPTPWALVQALPSSSLCALLLGGLLFGVGQVCYSNAFKYVGLGINCVINVAIGTSSVALYGLFLHPHLMNTTYGQQQMLGIGLFLLAVILSGVAGHLRVSKKAHQHDIEQHSAGCITHKGKKYLLLGVLLAIMAGVGVSAEGIAYTIGNPTVTKIAALSAITPVQASFMSWSLIFLSAWVPFFLFFFIRVIQQRALGYIRFVTIKKYSGWLLLMGVFYFVALLVFGKAALLIGGDLAPTIAWPLFMALVILVSNGWGYFQGEWHHARLSAKSTMVLSIVLLMAAIVVFSLQVS